MRVAPRVHACPHRLSTAAHIAIAIGLAACAGGEASRASKDSSPRDTTFAVALLTPGPISDRSWNGAAYEGLRLIADSLGARVSHIQTKTPAEFEENFRQYGTQGYDLVFGHGFEFQDAAVRAAPSHPRTAYVVTSGNTVRENVAGIRFGFEDPSYLAGMLAGAMTRSGTIGAIGGQELPPVKSSFDAFIAGVRAVRPGVTILVSYIGNWDDVSAGKEQALAQIRRGADIIFQNADAAGLGIFQAARESNRVRVIGSNADQNDVAPDVILASVVIDIPRAMLAVAREVRSGSFRARVIRLGTPAEVTRLVINPALAPTIPPAVRAILDSTAARMRAGALTHAPGGVEAAAPPGPGAR